MHGNADALSRRPYLQEACKHCDRLESLERTNSSLDQQLTAHDRPRQVATISLGQRCNSFQEIRAAQLKDVHINPVITLLEQSSEKPSWDTVAPYSQTTKVY